MATVDIDGVPYDVYADVDTADEYLAADFSAALWRAEADEDQKARALVTATRLLDRLTWLGEKTEDDQPLAWPRTGTGLADIDDDEIPQEIIDASIVLARHIHAGSTVVTSPTPGASNIKRQKAGSVEQEFFNPNLLTDPLRLPLDVFELVSRFFGGASFAGSIATGTCAPSGFYPPYTPSGPF